MSLATEVRALRGSVGVCRAKHVATARVEGPDALELLQRASTRAPSTRRGRAHHTLFLSDDASVFADAFIVSLGDHFLVLAEGPSEAALVERLSSLDPCRARDGAVVSPMRADWVAFGVDGPYAWELVAAFVGAEVLRMPYLTMLARRELLCLRAGKTGDYGYVLLAPRTWANDVEAELLELGRALDAAVVGREALDVCALESGWFTMRALRTTSLAAPLTPLELQLQWRVDPGRDFVGASALQARKAEGPKGRVTSFTAREPVASGARVYTDGVEVGEVLMAVSSPTLGCTVGTALLATRFAHPHLTLVARAGATSVGVRTVAPPVVEAVSLRVRPELLQTYASRDDRT